MELKNINFKRKITTYISLFLTILLLSFFVMGWIFFSSHIIIRILLIFSLLILLFCLSKFYVYKTYLNIKYNVIELTLINKLRFNKILKNDTNNSFIYRFYNKKDVNIKSSFEFVFDKYNILVKEFYVSLNKRINNKNISLSLKYIQIPYEFNDEFALILNYSSESEKYIEYYSYLFDKKKEINNKTNNKQYICLYKQNYDIRLLDLLDKLTMFHMLSVENNKINIIFVDDSSIFDFKLQKNIDSVTINNCHESYEKIVRIIKAFKKGSENNV